MASLTTNKNFLSPVGFQFKISSNNYPNLEYFATACTLPGFNLDSVASPSVIVSCVVPPLVTACST